MELFSSCQVDEIGCSWSIKLDLGRIFFLISWSLVMLEYGYLYFYCYREVMVDYQTVKSCNSAISINIYGTIKFLFKTILINAKP